MEPHGICCFKLEAPGSGDMPHILFLKAQAYSFRGALEIFDNLTCVNPTVLET